MFDQTFVDTLTETRKPWTVGVSLLAQSGLVAVALIVPLMHPEILHPKLDLPIFVVLKQLKQQQPKEVRTAVTPVKAAPRAFVGPARVPEHIAKVVDISAAAEPENFALAGPSTNIGTGAILPNFTENSLPDNPPPQPKPVPRKAAASGPLAVSTGVQSAKLAFGPKPAYPPLAKASRTQGTVKLEAIIAPDGSIGNLRVITGPPLLTRAAMDAVQQWRYQPTLLNGNAVEVLTEIDVVFTLN
jgi:protein TonB